MGGSVMDVLADLQKEKNRILSTISKDASEGKTELVLTESGKLEKIELLLSRHRQIISELEELKSGKANSPVPASNLKTGEHKKIDVSRPTRLASSRELGAKIRNEFLRKLEGEGIHLQLIKGKTIYRTKSGKRVGVAVATERQPNRWFLGLPTGGFNHAVLLCQRENGEVIEVSLPEKFFMQYGQNMSQSKGQLKFNIVRRSSGILVQVPGTDGISGTSFASDYTFLF